MANLDLNSLPKKGEMVQFEHKACTFYMVVVNARIRYGQIDVLIEPINESGKGSFWVTYNSVKVANTDNAPNVVEQALNS